MDLKRQNNVEENVPTKRIKVSNLPSNVVENEIKHFFENRKVSGGRDVESVDYVKKSNTAFVQFKKVEAVETVLSKTPLLFDKTTIKIERIYVEDQPDEYNRCTIEVTGMSQFSTKNGVKLYFESKKGANADVVSLDYVEEEEMYLIKFESDKVVDECLKKAHRLDKTNLYVRKHIPLQPEATYPKQAFVSGFNMNTTEGALRNYLEARSKTYVNKLIFGDIDGTAIAEFKTQPDIEKLTSECKKRQLNGCFLKVKSVPVSKSIILSNIKPGTTKDAVMFYFDNERRSGVTGVEEVDLETRNNTCIIEFVECEAPVTACKKIHRIEGSEVKVEIYHKCIGGTGSGDIRKFKSNSSCIQKMPTGSTYSTFQIPDHWEITDDREISRAVILNTSTSEYKDVSKKFFSTVGRYRTIVEIQRIQNKTLYQQYAAKKKMIDSTNSPGHQNEKSLWHGFAKNAMGSINSRGFNRSYCGKNAIAYGEGVYFARDANLSASDTYSVPDSSGNKRMYLCKVLTGEFTLGRRGMKIPPNKTASRDILYDCVVNNTTDPTIYIIFHDTQAYPAYMITFR